MSEEFLKKYFPKAKKRVIKFALQNPGMFCEITCLANDQMRRNLRRLKLLKA